MQESVIGIIGGSGLYEMEGLQVSPPLKERGGIIPANRAQADQMPFIHARYASGRGSCTRHHGVAFVPSSACCSASTSVASAPTWSISQIRSRNSGHASR